MTRKNPGLIDGIKETLILAQCSWGLKCPLSMGTKAWKEQLVCGCDWRVRPDVVPSSACAENCTRRALAAGNTGRQPESERQVSAAARLTRFSSLPCFRTGPKSFHQISPPVPWYFIGSMWSCHNKITGRHANMGRWILKRYTDHFSCSSW